MEKKGEKMEENKMGVMNVNKLLVTMAVPMMISMLIQALYNIVDSIFVAQYSRDGLTAVSLCFPVQSLMIALASGTGVGINSLLSRRLGEKRFEDANKAAENGIFLAVLSTIVVAIIGGLMSEKFFTFFTSTPATIQMGRDYMFICTVFSLGVFMQIVAEKLLQATGKTHLSMVSQMTGAIINIILDPILIFGLLGAPKLGVAGAAIATVAGQWFAMVLAFYLNHRLNHEVKMSFKHFKPSLDVIVDIYRVGIPAIIMQSITSIMTVGMNKILGDDTAISIFGIYFKINSFTFMPVFGLSNALIPIFAYNYGARKRERIFTAMRTGMIISVAMMAIGTALIIIFPKFFLNMFNADATMYDMGIPAMRIFPIGFCFAGFCIILISLYQSVEAASFSMIISIIRQLAVILPAAYILKRLWGYPAVWAAIPISEIVATVVCVIIYFYIKRTKLDTIKSKD